ncbi:hypothetical protein [Priestia aryabhattai]|uniref:hypothetical protein n=2 Tax=Priestia aryabhattai TaxID=412384 RepID=UPI0015F3CB02|nr:hypothetical protein [Priestia aryabhattai]
MENKYRIEYKNLKTGEITKMNCIDKVYSTIRKMESKGEVEILVDERLEMLEAEGRLFKYKNFLNKLNQLTKETGIVIETFGDAYYNPTIQDNNSDEDDSEIYFSYDYDRKEYVARFKDPYEGDEVK